MRTLTLAASLLLTLAQPLTAADLDYTDLTEEELEETLSFMRGNGLHTLFHEAGHMLVSEFGLPILGREEDSVDVLATLMLLGGDEEMDKALSDTADSFWMTSEMAESETGEEVDADDSAYYGEHGLDLQRAYQIVCLSVGHDPERFKDVADDYELPEDRREGCAFDYQQALTSWNAVLEPWQRTDGQVSDMNYVYDIPEDPHLKWIAEQVMADELLQRVAAVMASSYAFEPGITFRATSCGTINAFWSPSDREVTYCYELADYYGRQMIDWIAWERENGDDDGESDDE